MSTEEETKSNVIEINSLLYYQNPEIGNRRQVEDRQPPLQIAFPDGVIGIGMNISKVNTTTAEVAQRDIVPAVIVSGPEFSLSDLTERRGLKLAFLVLALVNLIVTIAMFENADRVDLSNVDPISSRNVVQSVFEQLASSRTPAEKVGFAFTIAIILLGSISIALDSVIGLSAYSLACLVNMLLGTAVIPVYLYSFRYVFDIVLLYFALVQRSKLMFSYLPTHIHGQ